MQTLRQLLSSSNPKGSNPWSYDPGTGELSHGLMIVPLAQLRTDVQVHAQISFISRYADERLLESFICSLSRYLQRNGETVSLRGAA